MTIIILDTGKQFLRYSLNASITANWKDVYGNIRKAYINSADAKSNLSVFRCNNISTPSASYDWNMFAVDSSFSENEIESSDYAPTIITGTTLVTCSNRSDGKGWNMVITVSGTSGDKINSLWFKKKLGYQYAGNQDYGWGYVFAVKLDTPVTIDSTGTANFTFSVEF